MERIQDYETVISKLTHASWDRVFVIYDAIKMGISLNRIHDITKIDIWYLRQYESLINLEKEICKLNVDQISKELLLEAKKWDLLIGKLLICWVAWRVLFMKKEKV